MFNLLVKEALERINKSKPQDQLTQDMRSKCGQIARELRFVGDALETRFFRELHLEEIQQENNDWRNYLENFTSFGMVKNVCRIDCVKSSHYLDKLGHEINHGHVIEHVTAWAFLHPT